MKTKSRSNKSLQRDNEKLLAELKQCYAANTCQVINHENSQNVIDETNNKVIPFNELVDANEKLRLKHKILRNRISLLMTQFNLEYNHTTNIYTQIK